jgi:hypothetical protein
MLHLARLGRSRRSENRHGFVRGFGALALLVAALASGPATPSSATHLPIHSCRDANIRSYRVTHITTNYTCAQTYRILRRLLRRGIRRLPKVPTRTNRWSCGKTDDLYICSRYGSGTPGRITFEVRKR